MRFIIMTSSGVPGPEIDAESIEIAAEIAERSFHYEVIGFMDGFIVIAEDKD